MFGFTPSERSSAEQLRRCALSGRVGSRWERRTHTHLNEITTLTAVHPDLRAAVALAVTRLAEAYRADAPLDPETMAVVRTALDRLHREGSFELRCWAADLREELGYARGRTLSQFLAPAPVPQSRTTSAAHDDRHPISV